MGNKHLHNVICLRNSELPLTGQLFSLRNNITTFLEVYIINKKDVTNSKKIV